MKDLRTTLRLLVDSGASINSLPATSSNAKSSEYKIYAANGSKIENFAAIWVLQPYENNSWKPIAFYSNITTEF